jgi:formate dehydrogenase
VVREGWPGKIGFADGKVRLWSDAIRGEFERFGKAKASDGLLMIGRRNLKSLNSWMHSIDRLVRSQKPTLLVHPDDARSLGLSNGDKVRMSTTSGELVAPIEISDEICPGAVSYPHGWGHEGDPKDAVNINRIVPVTAKDIEQVSGASILDGFPVSLERI